jgi:hypothetical protein
LVHRRHGRTQKRQRTRRPLPCLSVYSVDQNSSHKNKKFERSTTERHGTRTQPVGRLPFPFPFIPCLLWTPPDRYGSSFTSTLRNATTPWSP